MIEDLRRDLRGLVALESLLLATGIGALLVIAVRATLIAGEAAGAVSIGVIVPIAITHLLLALRVRAGLTLLRRSLCEMEVRQRLDEEAARVAQRSHPYRSRASRSG